MYFKFNNRKHGTTIINTDRIVYLSADDELRSGRRCPCVRMDYGQHGMTFELSEKDFTRLSQLLEEMSKATMR